MIIYKYKIQDASKQINYSVSGYVDEKGEITISLPGILRDGKITIKWERDKD